MTDLYAILPLGQKKVGKGKYVAVPLLRKRSTTAAKPGLTGAALERRIDALARNPLYADRIH